MNHYVDNFPNQSSLLIFPENKLSKKELLQKCPLHFYFPKNIENHDYRTYSKNLLMDFNHSLSILIMASVNLTIISSYLIWYSNHFTLFYLINLLPLGVDFLSDHCRISYIIVLYNSYVSMLCLLI